MMQSNLFLKHDNNTLKQLRNRFQNTDPLKIVLGAGDVWYGHQWIPTNIEDLDITNEKDWEFFLGHKKADHIVAEHVWEHLTPYQALAALRNVNRYLKRSGNFRIAVPDGYFPDQGYIDRVRPGGTGAGADDHKVLYNYDTLMDLLDKVPFRCTPLEWWDKKGKFHHEPWDKDLGFIERSYLYDERNNADGNIGYTSLIIDCKK